MRAFVEIASEFCGWVERPAGRSADSNRWLPQILAELIAAAYRLPDDGLADAGAAEYQPPATVELPPLPFQYYRQIDGALDLDSEEEVIGDLHDDLADIYRELSEGLFLQRQGSPLEAERCWAQSFRYHWGEHAVAALRALYESTSAGSPEDSDV